MAAVMLLEQHHGLERPPSEQDRQYRLLAALGGHDAVHFHGAHLLLDWKPGEVRIGPPLEVAPGCGLPALPLPDLVSHLLREVYVEDVLERPHGDVAVEGPLRHGEPAPFCGPYGRGALALGEIGLYRRRHLCEILPRAVDPRPAVGPTRACDLVGHEPVVEGLRHAASRPIAPAAVVADVGSSAQAAAEAGPELRAYPVAKAFLAFRTGNHAPVPAEAVRLACILVHAQVLRFDHQEARALGDAVAPYLPRYRARRYPDLPRNRGDGHGSREALLDEHPVARSQMASLFLGHVESPPPRPGEEDEDDIPGVGRVQCAAPGCWLTVRLNAKRLLYRCQFSFDAGGWFPLRR